MEFRPHFTYARAHLLHKATMLCSLSEALLRQIKYPKLLPSRPLKYAAPLLLLFSNHSARQLLNCPSAPGLSSIILH